MSTRPLTLVELDARVAALARGVGPRDLAPVWPVVAQMAAADVRQNIAEGHAPDGRPWVPLAHGRPGKPGGGKPLRDTGVLLASIGGRPTETGAVVGTNVPYAGVHQFGAVVRPTRAKFLAIPLTAAARRAGSPRRFPGNPKWDFVPTRTGGWVMVAARPATAGEQRRGVEPPREAQYVLVKEVTIPARPFLGFSPGLVRRVERAILDRAREVLGHALDGG